MKGTTVMGLFFNRKKDFSNMVFDWDSYYDDIRNNISVNECNKRMENLDYYIPKHLKDIPVADYAK